MCEETVSTTDTVTQEWMDRFDARLAEGVKQAVYNAIARGIVTLGEWRQSEPVGIIDIVDGERVFTPLVVGEPVFPADVRTKHIEL